MTLNITIRHFGDVTIVDVSGMLIVGEGISALEDYIRELTQNGHKKIILNMSGVNYIDSTGIGGLVSAFTTITNGLGTLKLLSLNKQIQDLLQLTKLYMVFEVHHNEAEAIRSFGQDYIAPTRGVPTWDTWKTYV